MGDQLYHLAQFNLARSVAELESSAMASFLELVPVLNSLAEQSPGFVWRLTTSEQLEAPEQQLRDPRIVVNLSLWRDETALVAYFRSAEHKSAFRKRHQWFEPAIERKGVLWWIRAPELPNVGEGLRRLAMLNCLGDTPDAFSFSCVFPPPGQCSST